MENNIMKKIHLAAAAAALVTLPAMAQEAAPIAPVEMFYCDLRDGAEMSDLKAVAADFAKWAKKRGDYSAWIITPQFRTTEATWQGSTPTARKAASWRPLLTR